MTHSEDRHVWHSDLESERVRVIDGLVPSDLRAELQKLVRGPIWAYGWKSVKSRDPFPFWHAHFAGADDPASCEDELLENPRAKPIAELWALLSKGLLERQVLVRAYANGHTYGGEGYIHVDSSNPRYFTTIYYAHPVWEADWAGETVFFEDGSTKSVAVIPEPGRIVHFSGNLPHVARSASRSCPELRVSIVMKTLIP